METKEYFRGIAVIIDNDINDSTANIQNILSQLQEEGIPYLSYSELPQENNLKSFRDISFILLDWELSSDVETTKAIEEGVVLPETLKKSGKDENITFIKSLADYCFCPIFIFSNQNVDLIIEELVKTDLFVNGKPNQIFVMRKSELTEKNKLFIEIDKWIKNNPSIYVLKEWEHKYRNSRTQMFYDFQKYSSEWPKILWKNYATDGVNSSLELGELISRNLSTRMTPFEFLDEILKAGEESFNKEELRQVLEGERFLVNANLDNREIAPGDVFYNSSAYYLNIRAACDLVPDRNKNGSKLDDVELYLLKGTRLTKPQESKCFDKGLGHFSEKDCQVIIFPIVKGKAIDFRFKDLEINTWGNLKTKRIGRILPPYITRIQQKYGLYIQRQGLPRIPTEAIDFIEEKPIAAPAAEVTATWN